MKVMTFNLRCDFILDFNNRWEKRKHIVYEVFNNYNPDIIGVQEVTKNMLRDLTLDLTDYNIIGSPRSKKYFVESNNILVDKKHSILEYDTFWLSKKHDYVGSSIWYSIFPRICTTALIQLEDKNKIIVCNTHLDFLLPQARSYGLKRLGEIIEDKYNKENLPIIIMGDFNARPNSKVIKNFNNTKINNKSFIAVQETNKDLYNKTTMSNFKGRDKGMHIDYIYGSEELIINSAEIIKYNLKGRYPSDHYPILSDITIK